MPPTHRDPSQDEAARQPTRARYEAPCIEESASFERLVLSCSHRPDVPFCEENPPGPSS